MVLILFLFSIGISAQNITEINSDIKLSNSLTYQTEVRIYQCTGITNYSSLFRMYKDKSGEWVVEFYKHYAKIGGQTELRTEMQTLKSENDMEFVFQNLIRSYIFDLPSLQDIRWKFGSRGNVKKVERIRRGKKTEKYEFLNRQIGILDGEGFTIQVKGWNKTNEFEYSNPDGYLKHYPEIDELIYMCEILDTIRNEFGIWEK